MVRIAILDLYEGFVNEGMRCIRQIITEYATKHRLLIDVQVFDVRIEAAVPDLSFDLYISTGGPGSPLDSEGNEWEQQYFNWLKLVEDWNNNPENLVKKHAFFICHSYQLVCRHYKVGRVCARKSTSFGIFPIHMLQTELDEPIFETLQDPFYAVDSRDYQVIEPNHQRIKQMGATILCIEKDRPHLAYERAIMAIRFNEYFVGTQFHPEADAVGMSMYLQREDRKKTVVDNHGLDKWQSMIDHLNDPEKILFTYNRILPNFLNLAIQHALSLSGKQFKELSESV